MASRNLDLCKALIATPINSRAGTTLLEDIYFTLQMQHGAAAQGIHMRSFGQEFIIYCPAQMMQQILLSQGPINGPNFSLHLQSCIAAYAWHEEINIDPALLDPRVNFDPGISKLLLNYMIISCIVYDCILTPIYFFNHHRS